MPRPEEANQQYDVRALLIRTEVVQTVTTVEEATNPAGQEAARENPTLKELWTQDIKRHNQEEANKWIKKNEEKIKDWLNKRRETLERQAEKNT